LTHSYSPEIVVGPFISTMKTGATVMQALSEVSWGSSFNKSIPSPSTSTDWRAWRAALALVAAVQPSYVAWSAPSDPLRRISGTPVSYSPSNLRAVTAPPGADIRSAHAVHPEWARKPIAGWFTHTSASHYSAARPAEISPHKAARALSISAVRGSGSDSYWVIPARICRRFGGSG
jgi:hypothetical protein